MINFGSFAQFFHFNPLLFFGLYLIVPVSVLTKESIRIFIFSIIIALVMNVFWIFIAIPYGFRPLYSLFFSTVFLLLKYLEYKLLRKKPQEDHEILLFEIPFIFIISCLSLQTSIHSLLLVFIIVLINVLLFLFLLIITEKMVFISNSAKLDTNVKNLPIRLIFISFWSILFFNFGNILLNIL